MQFRFGFAVLLPFLALGLQWLLWPWLSPLSWFLFFPTVFLSVRLGGFRGGLIATGLSAATAARGISEENAWFIRKPFTLSDHAQKARAIIAETEDRIPGQTESAE